MPTYAYTCTACGHAFDVHQSFDDAALTVCPQCEGRLRKVFSPVGVVFKGSGFYRTDARSSGGSKGATKEAASVGASSGSSSSGPSSSGSSSSGGSSSGGSSSGTTNGTSSSAPAPAKPAAPKAAGS